MNIFDGLGLTVMALYLLALVTLALLSRRARREESLSDFYLGGRAFGTAVLFLTLYATQYSGLTLIGFAGRAYRSGFGFLVSVTFGCSIIGGYLLFAPRLRALAEEHGFITFGDYLQHRYRSLPLTAAAAGVMVVALSAYVLSNLKAAGYVIEAATGGRVSFTAGVFGLSLLIVAYETLGGLRAVAWTDALQGAVLGLGCAAAFAAVVSVYGLTPSLASLRVSQPELFALPRGEVRAGWASTVVLVMFGVSIYPHAIQRIYAARSRTVLRHSLSLMLLMPFLTTLPMLLVGYIGAAHFPDLSVAESEQVVFIVLEKAGDALPAVRPLVVLLVCALLAAIMSTVDSALLAVSSLLTQDLYRHLRPRASQRELTRAGKWLSWTLMAAMALLAVELPQTLWRITELKLEILVQLAPSVFLGLRTTRLGARQVGLGLAAGLAVTALLHLGAAAEVLPGKPLGLHPGVWGVLLNVMLAAALPTARRHPARPVRGSQQTRPMP